VRRPRKAKPKSASSQRLAGSSKKVALASSRAAPGGLVSAVHGPGEVAWTQTGLRAGTVTQEQVLQIGRNLYASSQAYNDLFAYVQHGSWGYSNAGLITSGGASLLVDTLYDLALTRSMLDEMRRATPLSSTPNIVVNTHADGDHCWGNQLVRGARIISSRSAALEMRELSPKLMATLVGTARALSRLGPARRFLASLSRIRVPRLPALAEAAEFVVECFGSFNFRGSS